MIKAFFFGDSTRLLYGVYYAPDKASTKKTGILLCNPFGQEYNNANDILAGFATKLAQEGFYVFRFDYYGCGDSYGSFEAFSITQAIQDILLAEQELTKLCKPDVLIFMGLRLGASLSFIAAKESFRIHGLILWNPIDNGNTYLNEIIEKQKKWHKKLNTKSMLSQQELFGYNISDKQLDEVKKINLTEECLSPVVTDNILILNSQSTNTNDTLNHLKERCNRLTIRTIPHNEFWYKEEKINTTALYGSYKCIKNWLLEAAQ